MASINLWNNLKFSSLNVVDGFRPRVDFNRHNEKLVFRSARYQSVFVYIAKREAMREILAQTKKLNDKLWASKRKKKDAELFRKQREAAQKTLIHNQEKQAENWGRITAEGGHTIVAKTKYGDVVKESLMLYYDADEPHFVDDVVKHGDENVTERYSTKTVCHIDLSPKVTVSSNKNIVTTQVQGRDYTRKELVSGGDLEFSIQGNIVSDEAGIYPKEKVAKFIQVMQYGGILNVNFMLFEPFNVTRVIVKSFSLNNSECKNIQPYSFSCVAVEPDEDVRIAEETIATLNEALQLSPVNTVRQSALKAKLAEITSSAATSAAASAASIGMNALAPNI